MDLNLGKETSYFFSNSIPPRVIFSYILADQRVLHTFHLKIKRRKNKKKSRRGSICIFYPKWQGLLWAQDHHDKIGKRKNKSKKDDFV